MFPKTKLAIVNKKDRHVKTSKPQSFSIQHSIQSTQIFTVQSFFQSAKFCLLPCISSVKQADISQCSASLLYTLPRLVRNTVNLLLYFHLITVV